MYISKYPTNGYLDDPEQLAPFFEWADSLPEEKKKQVYEGMTKNALAKTENLFVFSRWWQGEAKTRELFKKCEEIRDKLIKEREAKKREEAIAERIKNPPAKLQKNEIPEGVSFWGYCWEHWEQAPDDLQEYR